MPKRARFWIAVFLAPWIMPLTLALGDVVTGRWFDSISLSVLIMILRASYFGFLTVGLPMTIVLHAKNWINIWTMLLCGVLAGPVWATAVQLLSYGEIELALIIWAILPSVMIFLSFAVLVGPRTRQSVA